MPSQPSPSPLESTLTRRSLLGAAAGGAALLATRGLPAWARPVAFAAGLRQPESLPFPSKPAGTPSMAEIEHIVVRDDGEPLVRQPARDGSPPGAGPRVGRRPDACAAESRSTSTPTRAATPWSPNTPTSPCQLSGEPSQSWNASHQSWDNGLNDGFVKASAPVAMRFWDKRDLPFTYSLVEHFPIGERYFSSVLGQTFPNRCYLFSGTSSGTINDTIAPAPPPNGTIWDRLDAHNIDWGVYYQPPSYPSFELVPGSETPARMATRVHTFGQFLADVAGGRLKQFTFLDPNYGTTSEENPQDIQLGERYLAQVVNALMRAKTWKNTVADHQLRRARRLLRPCATAAGDRARLGGADARARRCPGHVRPLRLPRAADRGLPVGTGPTTSRASSRTTPRSWRSSSASGTCPR